MQIAIDDLSDGAIATLLNAHLDDMKNYSPAESIHALTPEQLRNPKVTFWGARSGGQLAACGALKELTGDTGEIKAMKTDSTFLRQGLAEQLLHTIINEANDRSYKSLYLETGSHPAFDPAVNLYLKHGFKECGPFGDYKEDPFSRFYTLILE